MTTHPADPPCPRRDRWIRGCRFEPRYDYGEPVTKMNDWRKMGVGNSCIDVTTQIKTYVADVCVTCGRTIERRA